MESRHARKIYRATLSVVAIVALFGMSATSGFVVPSPQFTREASVKHRIHQPSGFGVFRVGDPSRTSICRRAIIDSSSVIVSAESWRQYVPLIVSVGIIIDILLGSPLANSILKPMRPEGDDDGENKKAEKKPSKARIDAELVAQQALDRANNALELKRFLEERKTDNDRMEEMKKKLDATMQDLDEDMEVRQKTIDAKKKL